MSTGRTTSEIYAERRRLRERIAPEHDEIRRRSLAGEMAGLSKRWTGFVIAVLTETLLGDARPGRERVRDWQKAMFGKSCSSAGLDRFGLQARNGGGRGEPVQVGKDVEARARQIFQGDVERFRELD